MTVSRGLRPVRRDYRVDTRARARRLRAKGLSYREIGERMGLHRSRVHQLLQPRKPPKDAS